MSRGFLLVISIVGVLAVMAGVILAQAEHESDCALASFEEVNAMECPQ